MALALGRDDNDPVMEMNTTPLIDVMLVLLVMFIITIPMQTHAVKVPLPGPDLTESSPNPVINKVGVTQRGVIMWNGRAIDLATLRQYLESTKALTPEPELHVQPDANARYDTVDQVLAVIKKSEITKLGFVGNEQYSSFGK